MFDMGYELGAALGIKNNLNLTPLTLAAKLARKELFFHILSIEREIYWQIGSVTCAAYPLTQFDTIDPIKGGIQKESALNLIVFGETTQHLDLLEGPVMDLLHAKWNTFVKFRFYKQFVTFAIYFLISLTAFVNRPIHKPTLSTPGKSVNSTLNATSLLGNQSITEIANATLLAQQGFNLTTLLALASEPEMFEVNETAAMAVNSSETFTTLLSDWGNGSLQAEASENARLLMSILNSSFSVNGTTNDTAGKTQWVSWSQCLEQPADASQWLRLTCECLMLLGSVSFLLGALRECQFLGASMFFENLVRTSYSFYLSPRIYLFCLILFVSKN